MNAYLIIIGKTSLSLMLFFAFYHFSLSKDKLFVRNRFFLLGSTILSFILPWISIPLVNSISASQPFTFTYIEGGALQTGVAAENETSSVSWVLILAVLYFSGTLFFALKTFTGYFQVTQIIRKALRIQFGKMTMVVTPEKVSPFSFLHWLVISEDTKQHPSFEKMVQHEMVHSRQYHSVDLLIAEILILLQWFNPFAWLIRKAMIENLEFIVDHEMLAKGTDAKEYQYSLLSFSMVGLKPAVANNFNTNLLKKRITMMNSVKYQKSSRFHNFLIPVCLLMAMLTTVSFKKEAKAESVDLKEKFKVSEPIPAPVSESPSSQITSNTPTETATASPNGEEYLLGYIMKNVVYPKEALNNNLEGTIQVSVKFTSNGAEILTQNVTSGELLKEVVVVAYANSETFKHQSSPAHSSEVTYLKDEVSKVLKAFSSVPKDLIGKTYTISVKFLIQRDIKVIGHATAPHGEKLIEHTESSNKDVKIRVRKGGEDVKVFNLQPDEVTYILNNEKIISAEEFGKISPETIESMEVFAAEKIEHSKFGIIEGSAILITLKK